VVLRLTADEHEEFEKRVRVLLDEFASRPDRAAAETFAVYVATYPSR
jgi:hypothetical protein